MNNQKPDPIVEKAITFAASRGMFESHSPHSNRNWLTVMRAAVDSLMKNIDLPVDDQQWWDILCKHFEQFENCIIEDYGEGMPEQLCEGLRNHNRGFIKLVKLSIGVLGLSTRIENALAKADIKRVNSLIALQQVPERLLGRTRNFGEKSLRVLNERLDQYRLKREQVLGRARNELTSDDGPSSRELEYLDDLSTLITPRHKMLD